MRAKEVQFKKGQYLKAKLEKKTNIFKSQVENFKNTIAEKDKVRIDGRWMGY
jgi:hypothetical protein